MNGDESESRPSSPVAFDPQQLCIRQCGLRQIKQIRFILHTVFPELVSLRPSQWLTIAFTSHIALYDGIVLGVLCYRLEADQELDETDREPGVYRCYVAHLACLAPYRRLGIGTQLLRHVIDACAKRDDVTAVCLHTRVSNQAAIRCYGKLGFRIVATHNNHYRNEDGYLMRKDLKADTIQDCV